MNDICKSDWHWDSIKRLASSTGNVWKYVFERQDAVAEAVLYRYPTFESRTVICCSTQSGCPVGCRFCGAGDSFVRSLSAEEIVSQPDYLMADMGIDAARVARMQIMFMSMGEPMLNSPRLFLAIEMLYKKYPKAALLISTIGPSIGPKVYRELSDLSQRIPTVGLQFSIHESTDAARDQLIPFKAKMELWEIAMEGDLWHEETGRRPFFNYCAHEGNTSDEDVARLRKLFHPGIWNCTVSVICERTEHVAAANDRQRKLAQDFMGKMMEQGYDTRCFDPAGQDDIGGGCGQLWYVQDWMKSHPTQARPSVGRGLPVIHAPALSGANA